MQRWYAGSIMARIKQLHPHEAQKIAAGEVVERPANVVKELVENSLDAGATAITIFIEDAGKSLIRVVDNGCGMSSEDAHLCFAHHATSKITHVDQLSSLTTFGFRGEALSSISSVAKTTLITKEADAQLATKLTLEQATVIQQEQITANTGTDIRIANLFYNVPARKKFLKTNDTEWRQIQLLFQAFCLTYTTIHFKLYSNETLVFNCPAVTTRAERTAQLWDHTIAHQIISLEPEEKDGITLEGIISNHTYARYDRSTLFFLVNNRWVKNYGLSKALLKGYMNVLPPEKFPLACLAITIDPAAVDINVHPRKEEVQFLHPRIIETRIQQRVKETLEKHLSAQLKKTVTLRPSNMLTPRQASSYAKASEDKQDENLTGYVPQFNSSPPLLQHSYTSMKSGMINAPNNQSITSPTLNISHSSEYPSPIHAELVEASLYPHKNEAQQPLVEQAVIADYSILGQFHKTYIIIEQDNDLFLVDQHAAHERILYEQFANRFKQVPTIQLMFPQCITLSSTDMALIEPHLTLLRENNIALEPFGATQLMVTAIPVHLKEVALDELIKEVCGWIAQESSLEKSALFKKMNEKLHAQMACKAAVKAGDELTHAQMAQLIRDLYISPNRFTCPHGRPTGWQLPLYEIEKKFKRKL